MAEIGQKIKLFFDDGKDVRFKVGVFASQDDYFITLDNGESIALSRIIRIEVIPNE